MKIHYMTKFQSLHLILLPGSIYWVNKLSTDHIQQGYREISASGEKSETLKVNS